MDRKYGGQKSYGYIWDPPNAVSRPTPKLSLPRSSESSAMDLLHRATAAYSQGHTGRCAGFAVKRAVQVYLNVDVSANCLYSVARCLERPSPQTPLLDDGCRPFYVMEGISSWSVAAETDWPSYATTVNREPNLLQLKKSSKIKLEGFRRIDSLYDERVDECEAAISAGFPVCFATWVTSKFEDYSGQGVIEPDSGKILGGHYLCLLGFDTINGVKAYYFSNSWGSDWGDQGIGVASRAYMRNAMDCYIMDVRKI